MARLAVTTNDMAESLFPGQRSQLEEFGNLRRRFTSDVATSGVRR